VAGDPSSSCTLVDLENERFEEPSRSSYKKPKGPGKQRFRSTLHESRRSFNRQKSNFFFSFKTSKNELFEETSRSSCKPKAQGLSKIQVNLTRYKTGPAERSNFEVAKNRRKQKTTIPFEKRDKTAPDIQKTDNTRSKPKHLYTTKNTPLRGISFKTLKNIQASKHQKTRDLQTDIANKRTSEQLCQDLSHHLPAKK